MNREYRLRRIGVAVGLALGSAAALAQPERDDPSQQRAQDAVGVESQQRSQPDRREAERLGADAQSRQEGSSRERSSALERDDEASQARSASGGAAEIDRLTEEHDDLSTFMDAIKTAGLADALTDGTEYTLFAPTNEAFESSRDRSADELGDDGNREQLTSLLRAHIVADAVDEEMARSISEARTIDGGMVELEVRDDQLMVDGATAEASPVELGALTVYKIDQVLSADAGASADLRQSRSGDNRSERSAAPQSSAVDRSSGSERTITQEQRSEAQEREIARARRSSEIENERRSTQ